MPAETDDGFAERILAFRRDAGLGHSSVPIVGAGRARVYVVRFNSTANYPRPFMNSYLAMIAHTSGHAPFPLTIIEAEGGSTLLDVARQNAVLSAMQQNADYVLMLDIDQVYPPDTLVKLLTHLNQHPDVGIIGSNIWKRQEPVCICAYDYDAGTSLYVSISDPHGPGGNRYVDALRDGILLVPVDAVGAGCLGINMALCLSIAQPWFQSTEYGEDLGFCRKAHAAGIKVRVALDAEIGHMVQDATVWPGGVLQAVGREWVDARYIAALEQRLKEDT